MNAAERVHGPLCRCADCRHERFKPGFSSTSRKARRVINHVDGPRKKAERVPTLETRTGRKRYKAWRKARLAIGARV